METAKQNRKLKELNQMELGLVHYDEPLRNHAQWRIGGPADALVEPNTAERAARLVRWCSRNATPLIVIGDGSNLLFDDAGVRGVVLKISHHMGDLQIDGSAIQAQAGVWVPRLARNAANAGLTGLEHTIGIPGALGGLIAMNGGSLQQGIGDVVVAVTVLNSRGDLIRMSREECEFEYRASAIQRRGLIVTNITLECPGGDRRAIRRRCIEILKERREKFPLHLPNCGSVFKRSVEMYQRFGPPGKVIEETGLKGFRVGDVQISHQHANFAVNLGGATSANVLDLIAHIRAKVFERTGLEMFCEVRHVSPEGVIRPAHEAIG